MPEADTSTSTAGWGSWSFNHSALTLDLLQAGLPAYSINVRGVTSSACMLDAIFDLKSKPWANNEVIGDLVTALQDLFDPRVTLCGGGRDRTFDPLSHFQTLRVQ